MNNSTLVYGLVTVLFLAGCTTAGAGTATPPGGPPEIAPTAAPAEPTEEVQEIDSPGEAGDEPAEIRFPIPEDAEGLVLTAEGFQFSTGMGLGEIHGVYEKEMEAYNCRLNAQTGGAGGSTASFFLCMDDQDEITADFTLVLTQTDAGVQAFIQVRPSTALSFDPPIPDGAEIIPDMDGDLRFTTGTKAMENMAYYLEEMGALNCSMISEVGSPESPWVYQFYLCLGEAGQFLHEVTIGYLLDDAGESGSEVSISVNALAPVFRVPLPDDAGGLAGTADGGVAFHSGLDLTGITAFYTAALNSSGCTLSAQTGGTGSATSSLYLCEDVRTGTMNEVVIVFTAMEQGSEVFITFRPG